MKQFIELPIIGYIHSPYKEKFGIPRQPNLVNVYSRIQMLKPYNDLAAFENIIHFSHLWLIWQFHKNKNKNHFQATVRPPRLGGNQRIGVFASRSMYRPSPIGLSVVRFLDLTQDQYGHLWLHIEGADLLDGTPILDIKPYLNYADSIANAQSGYAQQQPTIKPVYWQNIQLKQHLQQTPQVLVRHLSELEQILALDPRPAYHHDDKRIYTMQFANMEVQFKVNSRYVTILDIIIKP